MAVLLFYLDNEKTKEKTEWWPLMLKSTIFISVGENKAASII